MKKLNSLIDHTLLRPDATKEEILKLCKEAVQYGFASVCILPYWVPLAKATLKDSPVKVCSVVGFPLGCNTVATKKFEAEQLVLAGAEELDMVLNVGALKSGDTHTIEKEIIEVVKAAGKNIVKVILETCSLTDDEKIRACQIAKNAGAAFVKTSTGFGKHGATIEDIALMRKNVGPHIGVKASGGIRDYDTALKMVEAGATRIGTSAGVTIATMGTNNHDYY